MATYNTLRELFSAIANSIKQYKTNPENICAMDFPAEIDNLTANTTATASDILLDKTAWSNGEKITGTIPSAAAATITPGTSNETAISAGTYAAGDIVVVGDADLTANNIVYNKNIFGVTGNTWAGDLTFSGSYATSSYYTAAGSQLIVDKNTGYGFIIIQGGTRAASNSILFTASSLPSGVTMLTQPPIGYFFSQSATQPYNVAVLTGITKKINVDVALISASSQILEADLTVTYA